MRYILLMMSGKCQDVCHLLFTNHSTFKFTFKAVQGDINCQTCSKGNLVLLRKTHTAPSSSWLILLPLSPPSLKQCLLIQLVFSNYVFYSGDVQQSDQHSKKLSSKQTHKIVLLLSSLLIQQPFRGQQEPMICPILTLHHEHYAKPKEVVMLSKICELWLFLLQSGEVLTRQDSAAIHGSGFLAHPATWTK